eukprot:COSAG06_NODE_5105_length_3716_cov_2.563450_7_plen_78_part_00
MPTTSAAATAALFGCRPLQRVVDERETCLLRAAEPPELSNYLRENNPFGGALPCACPEPVLVKCPLSVYREMAKSFL